MAKTQRKPAARKNRVLTLKITDELDSKASAAAAQVGLKKSDTIRLAIERGLDRLVDQLT